MPGTRPTAPHGITQALLYTRISGSEKQREGLSLETQTANTRRYATAQQWGIAGEYVDIESGASGHDDRARYQAMLQRARELAGNAQPAAVVVARLDRLGRHVAERVVRWEELDGLGVRIHSAAEGLVSKLVHDVLAAVAEEESRRLGDRVAEVRERVRENGWKTPGRVAWGYRLRPRTDEERRDGAPQHVLERDPERAPYAAELFAHVARGESVRSAARWAGSLPAGVRGGRTLSYWGVHQLLTTPTFAGQYAGADGELRAGRWPALVDEAAWRAVQARIAGHSRVPHQATGRFLLTGLLRCPRCGSRMTGRARAGEGKTATYSCNSRTHGPADAPCQASVLAPALDGQVLGRVAAVVAAVSADPRVDAALRRAWDALRTPAPDADARREIRRHEATLAAATKRLGDAALLLIDGGLDRAGYAAAKAQIERQVAGAERELARLRAATAPAYADLPDWDGALAALGGLRAALEAGDVARQRDGLAFLIETVTPRRIGHGKYEADVAWTPVGWALGRLAAGTAAR